MPIGVEPAVVEEPAVLRCEHRLDQHRRQVLVVDVDPLLARGEPGHRVVEVAPAVGHLDVADERRLRGTLRRRQVDGVERHPEPADRDDPQHEHDVAEAAESPQDAASSFGHRNSVVPDRTRGNSAPEQPVRRPGSDRPGGRPAAGGSIDTTCRPRPCSTDGRPCRWPTWPARACWRPVDRQQGGADRTRIGRCAAWPRRRPDTSRSTRTSSSPRSASARSAHRRCPGPTAHRTGSAPAAAVGRSGSRRCPANCRDARRTQVAGTARATTLSAGTPRWRPPGSTIRRRASVRLRTDV